MTPDTAGDDASGGQSVPVAPTPMWTWRRLMAVTLAKAGLVALVGLAAWGALPALVGWHPTTVSSGSMMPRLHVGDIAVSRPLGSQPPPLSSVLLFTDPDHPGRLRMHRLVRIDDNGLLVTRGDANPADDSTPVELSAVRGIGTLRVPWIALPIVWVREGRWLSLALVTAGLVVLLLVAASGRDHEFGDDSIDEQHPDRQGPDDDPPHSAPNGAVTDNDRAGPDPTRTGSAFSAAKPGRAKGLVRRRLVRPARRPGAVLLAASLLLVGPASPAQAAFRATTTSSAALGTTSYFTCANAVAAYAPYLWYRMDETSSTVTTASDSSGGARTGVYGSAGKTTTTSKACTRDSGRSMTFNGSSGYLSSPLINASLPNTFTLSIWFRTTSKTGGKLIGFGNAQSGASGSYDRHVYMTNAGRLVFGVYPGATATVTSPVAYNDGAWHLVVASLSSAGMRLFVDGDLVASDAGVTTAEPVSSGYLRVAFDNLDGWPNAPTSRYFAGTLDDAAAFPTALSPSQVDGLYEAGTT